MAALAAEATGPEEGSSPSSALDYVRGLLGGTQPNPAARAIALPAPPRQQPALRRMAMPTVARDPLPMSAEAPPPLAIAGAAEARVEYEPPSPERSQWERLSLGENIELHIRRPLSRPEQRRVERLITIARQVLDEGAG